MNTLDLIAATVLAAAFAVALYGLLDFYLEEELRAMSGLQLDTEEAS
ncbi:MAG: hypothetical protein H6642_00070 [Caldilineaceae bacterium]|nr:hypothetical protein [Caldilineaceae bacterium]